MAGMKAWVYRPGKATSPPLILLEEVGIPKAGPEDLLIRVRHTSVCGTDEALFAGRLARAQPGIIPGHEVSGEVVECGPRVEGFQPGDIVALESHYSFAGATGDGVLGLWPPTGDHFPAYNGGYAEFASVPARCAHSVPPALTESDFWLSLFEPAGNDYLLAQTVTARAMPETVAVFGCGPHGLYVQIFLRHFGVETIVAFETDPFRRRFALDLGCARAVLDPAQPDLQARVEEVLGETAFDACVDMVGQDGQAFRTCCELVRDLGGVYLFGLFGKDFLVDDVPANTIIFQKRTVPYCVAGKTVRLVGVTGREGIWPQLIQTVASRPAIQQLLMKPVTVLGPLDELARSMSQRPPGLLKAAFGPFRNTAPHEDSI